MIKNRQIWSKSDWNSAVLIRKKIKFKDFFTCVMVKTNYNWTNYHNTSIGFFNVCPTHRTQNVRTEFRSFVVTTELNWKISLEILQNRDLQRIDQSGPPGSGSRNPWTRRALPALHLDALWRKSTWFFSQSFWIFSC